MTKNLKLALFLALKSIVKGNKITILIIVIMALLFINLFFIAAALRGILEANNKQIIENLTSNIVIEPTKKPVEKNYIANSKTIRQEIENIPGIIATAEHYKLNGVIAYDKEKSGNFKFIPTDIIGVNVKEEKKITKIYQNIIKGKYLNGIDSDEILLGAAIAGWEDTGSFDNLGKAKVGDKIIITFGNGKTKEFRIKGIFKTKSLMIDFYSFINTKEAKAILGFDKPSQIIVKIKQTGKENLYLKKIKNIEPKLEIKKWSDYLGAIKHLSKSFDIMIFIVNIIGLIAAAITIFVFIYIDVVHKKRQIGILKAIGINKNIIIYSYIFQSFFYAFFGIILGTLLIIYGLIPYFIKYPLQLPLGNVSLTLKPLVIFNNSALLFIVALIAALIPSRQIAQQNIIDAIWKN